jgi:hypothetical protein
VTAVLDALDQLDQSVEPLGLYACHDLEPRLPPSSLKYEWTAALGPALAKLGATDLYAPSPFDRPRFWLAPLGPCELVLRRVAKIKVRHFGSAYRVDDRVDYANRWARADIPHLLNGLRYPDPDRPRGFQALVLIGFARGAQPFRQELGALKGAMRGLEMLNRSWPDRYGRAFSVGLTAWWLPSAVIAA